MHLKLLLHYAASLTFFANASVENCNVKHTVLLHVSIKHFLLLLLICNITLDCLSFALCMFQLFYLVTQTTCQGSAGRRHSGAQQGMAGVGCRHELTVSSAPAISQSTTCSSHGNDYTGCQDLDSAYQRNLLRRNRRDDGTLSVRMVYRPYLSPS